RSSVPAQRTRSSGFGIAQASRAGAVPAKVSVADHAADHLALVHQVEGLVDALERELGVHHLVEADAAGHVAVDEARELRASLRAAEGAAAPGAARDEQERARVDLLAGAGDADHDRLAPAAVRAGERLAHEVDVADALEGVVDAAVGAVDDRLRDVADLLRVEALGRAEAARELELLGV